MPAVSGAHRHLVVIMGTAAMLFTAGVCVGEEQRDERRVRERKSGVERRAEQSRGEERRETDYIKSFVLTLNIRAVKCLAAVTDQAPESEREMHTLTFIDSNYAATLHPFGFLGRLYICICMQSRS